MPITPTFPGVYIEEVPSGVRTITGVATSITAFIGRAMRGPVSKATTINNYGDFERSFGGLWLESTLGFAVRDFYLNGGSQAIIVRLFHPTFASEDDRSKAKEAAQAVANAVTGDDVGNAATAARNKANEYKDEPQKSAADSVAKAAEAAAKASDAKVDSVKAAAKSAVAKAAPYAKSKISIGEIKLEAASEGAWGANLRVQIDLENITDPNLINMKVQDTSPGGNSERFLNLSVLKDSPRRIDRVLKEESQLVRWDGDWPDEPPDITKIRDKAAALETERKKDTPDEKALAKAQDDFWKLTQDEVTQAENKYLRAKKAREKKQNEGAKEDEINQAKETEKTAKKALDSVRSTIADSVSDGLSLTIDDFLPAHGDTNKEGMYTLEQADLFNLLCIPPYNDGDVEPNLISAAVSYCEKRRAMLLVDPPKKWTDKTKAKDDFSDPNSSLERSRNAAIFFPHLRQPNPLRNNQMEDFAPCGVVAGVMARTDVQRGVWKAPAGLDATLVGVPQLSVQLTNAENGELNPLGINCLRGFPITGRVIWGARTLRGADQLADEYKYIPVRRLALYIEESLYRGTQWVVFEPNDEPLWAQIRLNVGAFMHNLFRQGAFQGTTPRDAYFVKCDKETTTQNDINLGIVNIHVGFAPLKPAEFVIIKLQQMTGQIQT